MQCYCWLSERYRSKSFLKKASPIMSKIIPATAITAVSYTHLCKLCQLPCGALDIVCGEYRTYDCNPADAASGKLKNIIACNAADCNDRY